MTDAQVERALTALDRIAAALERIAPRPITDPNTNAFPQRYLNPPTVPARYGPPGTVVCGAPGVGLIGDGPGCVG